MALRNSNNYKICIVPETNYGVQNKVLTTAGGARFFADKLEWGYNPITTELAKKENSFYKSGDRNKITGKLVSGTISGDLTDNHEILLQAHFDDTSSPYLYPAELPTTLKSFNIYQLYLDHAGAVTSYDVVLGAIINPLVLSGEPNGIVQYTATIDGADYLEEVSNTAGNVLTLTDGTPVTGNRFLFGNIDFTGGYGIDTLLSFNLELRKTMVENNQRFMNSMTKLNDYYTQVGGTLQLTSLFDTVANASSMAEIYNGEVINIALIELKTNTPKSWSISIAGTVTEASRPDTDRGLFVQNFTADLSCDSISTVPVTITVS